MENVPFSSSVVMSIVSEPGSWPRTRNSCRHFSSASLALDTSSRTNTSLSVYRELVTMSKSRRVSAWNACVSGGDAPDAANPRAVNPPDGRASTFKDAPRAKVRRPGSTAIGPPRPTRLEPDRHRRSKVPSFPSDPSPKHELAETAGPLARADKRLGVHSGRSVRRDERASHMDARGVRFTAPEKCRLRRGRHHPKPSEGRRCGGAEDNLDFVRDRFTRAENASRDRRFDFQSARPLRHPR